MESVDITCDYGYKNSGKIPVCTGDGPGKAAWTNIPTCEAATCPITKIPNSDKADGITGKLNDVVAVKCTGATNAFAVTCIAIGPETAFWNGLVSCPETPADMCAPLIVAHGKASSASPSKEMETVDIVCDDGYEKIGSKAVCSSAGSGQVAWTNIPTCEAVSCPKKEIPNSNQKNGITGKVNEKVVVTCDGATDPFAVLCIGIAPGQAIWTGFVPCPVPTCPVPIVENGEASSKSPSKGMESVEITCKDGYKLVGDASANCVHTSPGQVEWDQIPTCEALPCPTKLIPMSDKEQEGIVGNVGPDQAAWSGVLPCYVDGTAFQIVV